MKKDALCLTVGKTALERVHKLLSKLDSIGEAGNLLVQGVKMICPTYMLDR
jgi:hypothetical protein